MSKRPRVSLDVAEMIAADLPDGAHFAMIEEMTGLEPAETIPDFRIKARPSPTKRQFVCPTCHRRFHGKGALRQHTRDKHPEEESNG